MKKLNYKIKVLFVFVVCALLSLPSLYMLGQIETTKLHGSEEIASLPSLHEKSFMDKDFQSQFEKWWQSHFYGRKFALKLKNQIYDWANLGLIHSGYSSNVIQGKDNYLFEKRYFALCSKNTKELQNFAKLKKELIKRGIELFVIIAPNKVVTYFDKVPSRFGLFYNQECNHSALIEQLFNDMGINVFNAQKLMHQIRQDDDYEPFSVTGTHWNHYGAGRTLQEAAKKFGWGDVKLKSIERNNLPYTTERDIANLLNLVIKYYPKQEFIKPVLDASQSLEGKIALIGNSFSNEFRQAILDSHLVKNIDLLFYENQPFRDGDVENILSAKRIIWVYTDIEFLGLDGIENGFVSKVKDLNDKVPYLFYHDFSKNSNLVKLSGFSNSEKWGTWTDGEYAEISFSLKNVQDTKVVFDLHPYLPKQLKKQTVDVFVNGNLIDIWYFEHGKPKVPTELILYKSDFNTKDFTISFKIYNPISPKELNLSNDYRKLGLGIRSMKVIKLDCYNEYH